MRFVVACLMVALSSPAWAEWTLVQDASWGRLYIDLAAVREHGQASEVWALADYSRPDAKGARSLHSLSLYDCAGGRFKPVLAVEYSGQMATGAVLGQESALRDDASVPWGIPVPDSIGAKVLALVCESELGPRESRESRFPWAQRFDGSSEVLASLARR